MQEAQQEPIEVTTDVMALAEAQALKDAELLAALQERKREVKERILAEVGEAEAAAPAPAAPVRIPMNRAQRRAQVRMYARLLAATERQQPVVNPTIIPKSARRRRKGNRRVH